MGMADLLFHVLGFAAPALALSLGMVAVCRIIWRKSCPRHSLIAQSATLFIASLTVLLAGLWLTGHDGRLGTYAAMVLACATCQYGWLRKCK